MTTKNEPQQSSSFTLALRKIKSLIPRVRKRTNRKQNTSEKKIAQSRIHNMGEQVYYQILMNSFCHSPDIFLNNHHLYNTPETDKEIKEKQEQKKQQVYNQMLMLSFCQNPSNYATEP